MNTNSPSPLGKKRHSHILSYMRCTIPLVTVLAFDLCGSYAEGSIDEIRRPAEQGNAEAQYYLGMCYYGGTGVPQDFSEAAKWFHLAAEKGNLNAQYQLGMCYLRGEGVPQDVTSAVKWLREAAQREHRGARAALRALGL